MKTKAFYYNQNTGSGRKFLSSLEEQFQIVFFDSTVQLLKSIKKTKKLALVIIDNSNLANKEYFELLKDLEIELNRSQVGLCTLSNRECSKVRIESFYYGIDDYISLALSDEEVSVRLINKTKRFQPLKVSDLRLADLFLSFESQSVFLNNDKLSLTPIEFKILSILMKYPQKLHSKEFIADFLWEDEAQVKVHSLDTHIYNLRRKISKSKYMVKAAKGRGISFIEKVIRANL